MDESPSYHLDIEGLEDPAATDEREMGSAGRPWVGILFECCCVYARVYRNTAGTAYQGGCPRCGARIRLAVGPNGTNARFFTAR